MIFMCSSVFGFQRHRGIAKQPKLNSDASGVRSVSRQLFDTIHISGLSTLDISSGTIVPNFSPCVPFSVWKD